MTNLNDKPLTTNAINSLKLDENAVIKASCHKSGVETFFTATEARLRIVLSK